MYRVVLLGAGEIEVRDGVDDLLFALREGAALPGLVPMFVPTDAR